MAWERLVRKYKTHTAPKLLRLKKMFTKKHLEGMSHDPDKWIIKLESLQVQMDNIDIN